MPPDFIDAQRMEKPNVRFENRIGFMLASHNMAVIRLYTPNLGDTPCPRLTMGKKAATGWPS